MGVPTTLASARSGQAAEGAVPKEILGDRLGDGSLIVDDG
jgi:hypothetical protein